jgi:hypothetical protein
LGLTIAALVGLWPSNIARFPNPSTIPLDTLHGLPPPLFWISGSVRGLPPWT